MASVDQLYGVPQRRRISPLDFLYGASEMAANAITGGIAQLGGGLAYLPAYAAGGNDAGQATMQAVQDALTYQPRGEAAQRFGASLGGAIAPFAKSASVGAQTFADNVYNATGSPLLGAAARAAPTAIDQLVDRAKLSKFGRPATREITAYHGSPHDFDQFSTSKIGTGEGAQVYGHGLYFAESPRVAKGYQKSTSNIDLQRKAQEAYGEFDDPDTAMESLLNDPSINADQKRLLTALKNDDWLGFDYPHQAIKAVYKNPSNFELSPETEQALKSTGKFYTVDIPDEHVAKFLDWDKPLSEQPEILRILRDRLPDDVKASFDANVKGGISGANAYKNWVWGSGKGDAGASAALKAAGIPGIRYLDQGSRGAGAGTSNFVVFDDKLIKMLKKE